jgi:hypothetical protein
MLLQGNILYGFLGIGFSLCFVSFILILNNFGSVSTLVLQVGAFVLIIGLFFSVLALIIRMVYDLNKNRQN